VTLDAEAWDRLITWIDLHTPAHGTWHEIVGGEKVMHQRNRRREMNRLYAGIDEDPEAIGDAAQAITAPLMPEAKRTAALAEVRCPGWPFDAAEARRRQAATRPGQRVVDLGRGVTLELVLIPPGEFVMGDLDGDADEQPRTRVKIERPFWMGKFEVTNQQYALFDPGHDSRLESGDFLHFSVEERGYPLNRPRQPVVRVSWHQAMAFCRWLSGRTGQTFALPTEAEWEYACRAGSATPFWYGGLETDFAPFANLADTSFKHVDTFDPWKLPSGAIPPYKPAVDRINDKHRVSATVGTYRPNPWGLCDIHGNVSEWTPTVYSPYPYDPTDVIRYRYELRAVQPISVRPNRRQRRRGLAGAEGRPRRFLVRPPASGTVRLSVGLRPLAPGLQRGIPSDLAVTVHAPFETVAQAAMKARHRPPRRGAGS
jgi:formylglycine-generating enzyme required for sulfatase activity